MHRTHVRFPAGLALALGVLGIPGSAGAHIAFVDPPGRYSDDLNKACPCGSGTSNRICNEGNAATDPNRGTQVTTFTAGSTVTLRFDEYIDHSGRYRVAFDPDGADMADFNANVLLDIADPAATTGIWEVEVVLPDTPCTNCTLQLIQVMDGNTANPVVDPTVASSYYVCADIALVADGGGDLGDGTGGPTTATSGSLDSGGGGDATTGADSATSGSTPGPQPTTGTGGAATSGGTGGSVDTTTGGVTTGAAPTGGVTAADGGGGLDGSSGAPGEVPEAGFGCSLPSRHRPDAGFLVLAALGWWIRRRPVHPAHPAQ